MNKKKVPDWLNSSLWISAPPPPADDRPQRPALDPLAAPAEPLTRPPVPVPPPSAARPEQPPPPPPPEPEVEEPRDGNGGESREPGRPSAEEMSRQSQLLAEVSESVLSSSSAAKWVV